MNKIVRHTNHSALESSPLRLGFIAVPGQSTELANIRFIERGKDRASDVFEASLVKPDGSLTNRFKAVIGDSGSLITMFFSDNREENGLSKLTKNLDPELLLKLHPFYKEGLTANFKSLTRKINQIAVEEGRALGKAESEEFVNDSIRREEEAMILAKGFQSEADELVERNAELKAQLDEATKNAEVGNPSELEWEPNAFKLLDAKIGALRGKRTLFVKLEKNDGSTFVVKNNWATAVDAKLLQAELLRGKLVKFSTWKNYRTSEWFMNLTLAQD